MNYWIQGLKFIDLADNVFRPCGGSNPFNHIAKGDYRYLENTFSLDNLKDGDIIYTHTFYIDQLFAVLTKGLKLTVISHNCDIPAEIVPPEGVKWYSSNVNISHPRVIALPFGIQDDKYFPEIGKRQKMINKLNEPRKFKNLIYMDHRKWVNPEKRIPPYEILQDEKFVTAIHAEGTDQKLSHETPESFDRYLDNLYSHPYVICPEGNGIDTCRPWEALYMGVIPIMKRTIHHLNFSDLPILFIDDWKEVTIELLINSFNSVEYNPLLDFNYWKGRIYENSRANGRVRRKV